MLLSVVGGVEQKCTLLFSDIRSFSTLSEGKIPEQVVAMLNGYFTHMIDVLYESKGTLDKFIGLSHGCLNLSIGSPSLPACARRRSHGSIWGAGGEG
jgi:hypothetical protein